MARPTANVLTLLDLLQSGGVRTMTELADRLGVEPRTVRRYMGHLTELGVPIESVRGRYGGYRLAAGYRLPPLMLSDDEALAVLLGLLAGRRSGLATATGTANETAAAKLRRVLPARLAQRLDAVLEAVAFTTGPGDHPAPRTGVLLTIADAVRHHRPVVLRRATGRDRTLHPYGLVNHSGRWYVTGVDPEAGEERTFRLDRLLDARTLPGSFPPSPGIDPAERVLSSLARAPYRHEVSIRVRGTPEQIRRRLPAGIAELTGADDPDWQRVAIRAESLDWLPGVLASLDMPFVIERPQELRDRVVALADRLWTAAGTELSTGPPGEAPPLP